MRNSLETIKIPPIPDCFEEFTGEIPVELPAKAEEIAEALENSYLYRSFGASYIVNYKPSKLYDIQHDYEYAHNYDVPEDMHSMYVDKITDFLAALDAAGVTYICYENVNCDFYVLRVLILKEVE